MASWSTDAMHKTHKVLDEVEGSRVRAMTLNKNLMQNSNESVESDSKTDADADSDTGEQSRPISSQLPWAKV